MNQEEKLNFLIEYLQKENEEVKKIDFSRETFDDKLKIFRKLVNIRQPKPISKRFLQIQDAFLTKWNKERKLFSICDLEETKKQIYVWQGDITQLNVDSIVNAANSRLLGCMIPNHSCIDNIIHTRAGVQLRLRCHELITKQNRQEAAGKAKITKAYNLPARFIIHTVGPFIDKRGVTPLKRQLLQSCYQSSLKLADQHSLDTIAFCCIATGEFNFPNEEAAKIAIQTVQHYLQTTNSKLNIVFNVFKDKDLNIYHTLLNEN